MVYERFTMFVHQTPILAAGCWRAYHWAKQEEKTWPDCIWRNANRVW